MTSQSEFTPPDTATIAETQDSLPALRLLLGQRRLYSRAKRWSFLRWLGFSILGVAAPLVAVFIPSFAVVVGAVAGGWIFLSRTLFSSLEASREAKAASIQEDFDLLVFGMPEIATRDPRATPEELADLVGPDDELPAAAASESLTGWYPLDPALDGQTSIAIAQRANAAYAERLQTLNANCWLAVVGIWVVAALALSFFKRVELVTFMLGVVLPILPAALDVLDQWRQARAAAADRRSMATDIEDAIRGTGGRELSKDDLLLWQERLYSLRRRSPQVPNLVYRGARRRNEQAMNAAAADLSAVAQRLGRGPGARA
jgi:SMODS-associating 4TM effector domain